MNSCSTNIPLWLLLLGLLAQFLFSLRFIIQWVSSEIKKESHIPIYFWYLSIFGGILLLLYAVFRSDPVIIIGQAGGLVVYVRNLVLISRKKRVSNVTGLQTVKN